MRLSTRRWQHATSRYVAWMATRGVSVRVAPREEASLRVGDWVFFDSGIAHGRVALDDSLRAVEPHASAAWYAFFTTPGMTARAAMTGIAWLFAAEAVGMEEPRHMDDREGSAAPTLVVDRGAAKLTGWMGFPRTASTSLLVTISATPAEARLVVSKTLEPEPGRHELLAAPISDRNGVVRTAMRQRGIGVGRWG